MPTMPLCPHQLLTFDRRLWSRFQHSWRLIAFPLSAHCQHYHFPASGRMLFQESVDTAPWPCTPAVALNIYLRLLMLKPTEESPQQASGLMGA